MEKQAADTHNSSFETETTTEENQQEHLSSDVQVGFCNNLINIANLEYATIRFLFVDKDKAFAIIIQCVTFAGCRACRLCRVPYFFELSRHA